MLKNDNFLYFVKNFKRVHIIGASGVSMSAIATHLKNCGLTVTGCDKNPKNKNVLPLDILLYKGHSVNHLKNVDAIIYTSAINKDNIELIYAKNNNIPIFTRAEILSIILSSFTNSIGISGSHGKTTCTAMLSHIMYNAKLYPTCFIGGNDYKFFNYLNGKNDFAILECCEYKKNFITINPNVSVVLNADNDHLDCYKNFDEIISSFNKFCKNKVNFINADEPYFDKIKNKKTISFGINNGDFIRAVNLIENNGFYTFTVNEYFKYKCKITLKIKGKFNIYNALASISVARYFGVSYDIIKTSLEEFCGVNRRNEYLGKLNDCNFYADYAHHPKEIEEFIKCIANNLNDLIIFQPHTYSRTQKLFNQLVDALSLSENVAIYKTYSAREKYNYQGSAKKLYLGLLKRKNCHYINSKTNLIEYVKSVSAQYKNIYFVGAGDIYEIAKEILTNNN